MFATTGGFLVETTIARTRHAAVERRAHDGMVRILQNDLLGGEFGFAIDMNRIYRISLGIIAFAPVKDEVRGKKHELNVCRESGQMRGGVHIHAPGQIGILGAR